MFMENKLLILLDSMRFDSYLGANTPTLDKLQENKFTLAYSIGVFTIPTIISYLLNYPPIQPGKKSLFSGIGINKWLPKVFQKKKFITAIYTGHPWIPMINMITEGWFLKNFIIKRLGYKQSEVNQIIKDIVRDVIQNIHVPMFIVILFYNTHFPFKRGNLEALSYTTTLESQIEEIERVDKALSELFDFLKTIKRNSEVVVTSDHGDMYGGKPGLLGHDPTQLMKWSLELVQIPFITGTIKV